jgi:xanthosine utilization system XapX-like protein
MFMLRKMELAKLAEMNEKEFVKLAWKNLVDDVIKIWCYGLGTNVLVGLIFLLLFLSFHPKDPVELVITLVPLTVGVSVIVLCSSLTFDRMLQWKRFITVNKRE